jgi:hypothetical protein
MKAIQSRAPALPMLLLCARRQLRALRIEDASDLTGFEDAENHVVGSALL